jgi:hypothetical protein
MDILSIAGFALNVYSYVQEHVVEEEKKSGPIPELVATDYRQKLEERDGGQTLLDTSEGQSTVTQYPVVQQKVAVRDLLHANYPDNKSRATLEVQVATAAKATDKSAKKQTSNRRKSHLLVQKRSRKIDSGVDQGGRYYLTKTVSVD